MKKNLMLFLLLTAFLILPADEKPGASDVMTVKFTQKSGQPVIETVAVSRGRLNSRCRDLNMASSPEQNHQPVVYIFNKDGVILHRQIFSFPVARTVPPALPGSASGGPDILPLEEPEVFLFLPWFEDAASVSVFAPFQSKPSSTVNLLEHPPVFIPAPERDFSREIAMTGDPALEDGLNIMIMASGYTESTISQFTEKALEMKNYLLGAEPFRTYASQIAFHIYPNLADVGCAPGCGGIDRLLCCDSSRVAAAALASGLPVDEIVVLHHTLVYCGGGYRENLDAYKTNSYSTYCATYDGDNNKAVALHELGHSFGNLCDEYTYGSEGYVYSPCVNCRAQCSDWSSISGSCQKSCDAETNYYRPANSIMLGLGYTAFNDVSLYSQYLPDGLFKRMKFFTGEQTLIYVPITAALQHEKAWLVIKDYAAVTIRFSNPDASNIHTFVIKRKTRDSQFSPIAEIPSSQFAAGEYTHYDKEIRKNQGYIYKVEALNNQGTIIGISDETGI